MSFGAERYLPLLLLAPAVLFGVAAWAGWRQRLATRFPSVRGSGGVPSWVLPTLLFAAIALAAFASARPQFGRRTTPAADRGVELVIVMDVSQSMLATDSEPSRLGRAQVEVAALLERMRGDRAGLVIFAGQPFTRAPLTDDLRAVGAIVRTVDGDRNLVPAGSNLYAAVRAGQRLLQAGTADTRVMLIVSDGEDRSQGLANAIAGAREAGVRVYTAGVGTAEGAPVLDPDPDSGQPRPRLDAAGAAVVTRLDAGALRALADAGGGRYVELSGDGRPLTSLAAEFRDLPLTRFAGRPAPAPVERFPLFAGAALLVLLTMMLAPAIAAGRGALRRAARMLPLVAGGAFVAAVCSASAADVNRSGNASYDSGRFADAINQYRTAEAKDPNASAPYYNAGNAFNRIGQYDRAIDETQRSMADDVAPDVGPLAEYALGNHYAAARRLEEAREAYKRSLLLDPNDADAKKNLEIIDQRLNPTPTPTPSPTPRPQPTDQPGQQGGDGTPQAGTPGPGQQQGTATAESTAAAAPNGDNLTPEQLQQALEDALSGSDRQFTPEEAARILDLLEQQRRQDTTPQRNPQPDQRPEY